LASVIGAASEVVSTFGKQRLIVYSFLTKLSQPQPNRSSNSGSNPLPSGSKANCEDDRGDRAKKKKKKPFAAVTGYIGKREEIKEYGCEKECSSITENHPV
jgi:hypothetical protein